MNKKITMKTNLQQILKLFRECKDTESVNLEMPRGYIYLAGGILNKIEGNNHFIAHKGRWVQV